MRPRTNCGADTGTRFELHGALVTHVIAHRPATRTQPSVLKGLKREPSNEAESKLVKRRLVEKQPPPIAYQKASTS